jgi:hypothetical protein
MDLPLFIQAVRTQYEYLLAEEQARAVLRDAQARMDAVARDQSPFYNPDLGSWRDWLR